MKINRPTGNCTLLDFIAQRFVSMSEDVNSTKDGAKHELSTTQHKNLITEPFNVNH